LPTAKIRCFYRFLIKTGTVAVSAWILALIYIGLDVFTLLSQEEVGGINLIAQVSDTVLGFLFALTMFQREKPQISIY